MLGQPVAKVAPRLGMPGEIERVVQRVGRVIPSAMGERSRTENGIIGISTLPGKGMLQLL